jgi:hypothetical protein
MDTLVKKKRLVLNSAIVCVIFFLHFNASAQVVLPKDETGKITYLDVVKKDSIPSDSLFKRMEQWVKFTYAKSKMTIDPASKRAVTRGRFLVYTNPGVLKEIHGAIRYDISIEIKENRYRYTFTNFVFEYYKQDRYYKYTPTGKEKALEEEKFPGWQAAWEKHKNNTDAHVKEKIEDLYKAMENKKPETMVIQPVKKTQDW